MRESMFQKLVKSIKQAINMEDGDILSEHERENNVVEVECNCENCNCDQCTCSCST